jgi:N6-adenosine-specific RNA methylase IME4
MESHPIADHFPRMTPEELATLASDIREHGLHRPIVMLDGRILDGRNRFEACAIAGVAPRFVDFDGADPYAFVWSENAERRHLRPDQKVGIRLSLNSERARWEAEHARVAEEANRKRSEAAKEQKRTEEGLWLPSGRVSRDTRPDTEAWARSRLAKECGVSASTAGRVLSLASSRPDLLERVAEGAMSALQALRVKKKDEVASRTAGLPTGKYRVLYADPPWRYSNSGIIGSDNYGHVERHYPTLSIEELCALEVRGLADDNAVLFLWVTSPLVLDASRVIDAWGFKYKTSFVWDKVRHNFGHYNSVRHEFLLVCTRGSCLPDVPTLVDSVQSIERTEHSAKPEEFRRIIDRLYTHGRRLELFARGAETDGWDRWGGEAE